MRCEFTSLGQQARAGPLLCIDIDNEGGGNQEKKKAQGSISRYLLRLISVAFRTVEYFTF